MAGKMSTIVMMVDLECDRCYRKIRRVLCKLQDKASIKAISYDEKNNTVTVAGPFDADEVSDRLCSSAGKVITDIRVVGGAKPMPGGGGGGAKAHANKPAGKDGSAGGGGGGGGGKPEMIKKHVKFEMADDMDDGRHHHHHDNRKPKGWNFGCSRKQVERTELRLNLPGCVWAACQPAVDAVLLGSCSLVCYAPRHSPAQPVTLCGPEQASSKFLELHCQSNQEDKFLVALFET
ncbi:hypothetical protein OsJ_11248 [Oryza sativa Japonica Group]|uniref:HMA domain-containing protein n=1 Tax=Oryza sativa subsp. japonica TaxID=39947 RepID=B9F8Z8_ORYSJ|nr:hypothetical protein OsJ_11248 [Oryza sativa Japonica Group]